MALHHAERRVILFSAGTAAYRLSMREHARRLMTDVDWSRLTETLRLRRLLPVLGPRILELAGASADDGFSAAVEDAIQTGRRQGAFLQLVSTHAMSALADVGIRATPLKGPLLGEAIYGDPGRRFSTDIDLLVAPDQLDAAVEVVRGLGYGAPTGHVHPGGLPLLHFALTHERGELPPIELHWRIHWYERNFARERLLPPAGDTSGEWRPSPADEFASLLLFYARDGFVGLRLATDLSAWWDVFGANLREGALNELVRDYPALARVLPAAVKVAEGVVRLPATQTIAGVPAKGVRIRAAVRLANPNPHASQPQLHADMGVIDGLLAPPGGFAAFVRRQVLPPREVLDERASQTLDQRGSSRLGHIFRVLVRYGLTMLRLFRPLETRRVE